MGIMHRIMNMNRAPAKSTRESASWAASLALFTDVLSQLGCRVSKQSAGLMIVITVIICVAAFGGP